MSELKARTARSIADEEEMLELGADCPIESAQVYLKSEVDKVISELKADYDEVRGRLQTANLIKDEQLAETRHQKWKRCLAMAKICENKLGTVVKPKWWDKWRKRWLSLADKFKDKEA